jgi:hypothetical protein
MTAWPLKAGSMHGWRACSSRAREVYWVKGS